MTVENSVPADDASCCEALFRDQKFDSQRRDILKMVGAAGASVLGGGMTAAVARAAPVEMELIAQAVAANHSIAVQRLRDWVGSASIAAENRNMEVGAATMMQLAKDAGFQTVERVATDGFPGVFATLDAGAKHWLAVYFMYDVKQFDPTEWSSPPLEGRLVDKPGLGKIMVGRGAHNQKGPEATLLAALHAFKTARVPLPVNLVLIAEGEEEISSPHFSQIVQSPAVLAALRRCVGVIAPASLQSPATGAAVVDLGAKGVIEFELIASGASSGRGPAHDIHSSEKARVDSPAWRLVQALATLVSADGNTPLVDGFFENVRPPSPNDLRLIHETALSLDEDEARKALAVKHWIGDASWEKSLELLAMSPTLNIEGIVGGYTGPGGKTIEPATVTAKLDSRLVPNQTKSEIVAKIRAHLDKRGFQDIEMRVTGGYDPTETSETSDLTRAVLATYRKLGVPVTIYPRLAGSWPGIALTGKPVDLPALHFGIGHGAGDHAPNEYFVIESARPKLAGMDAAALAFAELFYQVAQV